MKPRLLGAENGCPRQPTLKPIILTTKKPFNIVVAQVLFQAAPSLFWHCGMCVRAQTADLHHTSLLGPLPGQTLLGQLTLETNDDQDCAGPVLDAVRLNLSCCMLIMHNLAHKTGQAALAERRE